MALSGSAAIRSLETTVATPAKKCGRKSISSPIAGWDGPRPERHHDFIDPMDFPDCWRDLDATIEVEAKANGHSIRFVVDTGATVVVLNRADAAKLGLTYESLPGRAQMRTVNGSSAMRWARIERMEMAGKRIEQISAAVVDGALPVSLMGQNALQQLGTVTLSGDTLTIH